MDLYNIVFSFVIFNVANSVIVNNSNSSEYNNSYNIIDNKNNSSPDNVFNGVYTECFMHLSYSCLQKKTLLYLKELNSLSEVSVIGDYVKFVKINTTSSTSFDNKDDDISNTDELAFLIDKAVDNFFDNHVLKFNALGRDISLPRNMEFVGRKKRKGGGGGGDSMMGGHFGHDDGGKKKMMMMAMMCMKMKLMMMVPAMMGMMGMMSFKGMMFSMMSFMISKMMLLMKILEKKGGAVLGGGGGGDGGWAAAGGGGGAWMPAGAQDYGGASGGYDANAQWQSRSIAETLDIMSAPTVYFKHINNKRENDKFAQKQKKEYDSKIYRPVLENPALVVTPEISFVKPTVTFNNEIKEEIYKKPISMYKKSNVELNSDNEDVVDAENNFDLHTRVRRFTRNYENIDKRTKRDSNKMEQPSKTKRSILDILQNSYNYWMSKILGINNNNRRTNFQKYKIINGMKYVYYPYRLQRPKTPKEIQLTSSVKVEDQFKPIITAEDFNKGEIMEGAVEPRMNRKKFTKMKETLNETMEDNPWE